MIDSGHHKAEQAPDQRASALNTQEFAVYRLREGKIAQVWGDRR